MNGLNPTAITQIINIYVLTRLLYESESLPLSEGDIQPLEKYYRDLRQVQHLPSSNCQYVPVISWQKRYP